MENYKEQLKLACIAARDDLKDLFEEYKMIESKMKSPEVDHNKKLELANNFEKTYKRMILIRKNNEKQISQIADSNTRHDIIKNNKEINKIYNSYLWYIEEVEYLYPHARSAVSKFLKDNKSESVNEL